MYKTLEWYADFHNQQDVVLRRNITKPNGRLNYSEATLEEFRERSSSALFAINCRSRIIFAEAVHREMVDIANEIRQKPYFFVTIATKDFTVPLSSASPGHIKSLIRRTKHVLKGLDYVGVVEYAFFNRGTGQLGCVDPVISVHIHAVVWGCEEQTIKNIVSWVKSDVESLVPHVNSGHFRPIKKEEIGGQILYMLKAPWLRYSVIPRKNTVIDSETKEERTQLTGRFKIRKFPLLDRPGEAAKIAAAMTGLTLPDLFFASGEGQAVYKRSLAKAVNRINREDQDRRGHLQRLLATA